jgi:hypothetical protein
MDDCQDSALVDVEIDDQTDLHSHFFVDRAHPRSIFAILIILSIFAAAHIAVSYRAPKILSYSEISFAIDEGQGNSTIDLDVMFSGLYEDHRFLDVNCTFVRRYPPLRSISQEIEIASRSAFRKNETVVATMGTNPQSMKLEFVSGSRMSDSFRIMHREVRDYDHAHVRLTIATDFDPIDRLVFKSCFANPSAFHFSRVTKLLLAILLGYMMMVYLSFLSFDGDLFTELFCVLLGLSGVLSCNPLTLFLPSPGSVRLSDHVLLATFVALFRMFCLLQLEVIRARSSAPNVGVVVILAVFFCCYATVDAAASFDRAMLFADAETETSVVLPTETLVINFDWGFTAIFGSWFLLALIHSQGFAGKRLWVVTVLASAGIAAAAFAHGFCLQTGTFAYTLLPSMVHATVHMLGAGFVIFFLHGGEGSRYASIVAEDGGPIADAMTSGDEMEEGFAKETV